MIDFRYHLVSLISVFLALAVGIILGAGPLQGTIGDQLTEQVDTLRAERNDLRDALTASEADADQRLQFIEAAGPALVEGSLQGVQVAVVNLDDVGTDLEEQMADAVEAAGGTVATTAALTAGWTDEEHEGLRDTIAGGMRPRLTALVGDLPEDAPTDELLAAALGVALGGTDTAGTRSDDAMALEQQLVQADLITVEGNVTAPADVVLLLTAASGDSGTGAGSTPAPGGSALDAMVTLARTIQPITPAVVAGPAASGGDVMSAVRNDNDAAARVSTASGLRTPVGRIVLPLALAAHLGGEVGHYGFEAGTTPLPPIVQLPDADADTGSGGDTTPEGSGAEGSEGEGAGTEDAGTGDDATGDPADVEPVGDNVDQGGDG
ncbi:hypothetical protein Xcel_1344 [Xylanimonas cellulosilytica DSM 15894]|uniref:Copper transport outer membrane protein MctB n=1 Tax=Xylanimonas cellulosilytica (strain DSM 15894 / JCM 12276 / CECT 5975 / KCTC 9989 / LMG 20990 / NBRC 107835 / XIL07) TaxID=446471 RepID=D1BRC0_XYLCX|nr:copper transporter [Xylanimonas cellulosilytica]ACZ30375.1 hypothetical protein Xcel_1344 [Xylanimonas cellulosilytica DSM 15894]